MIREWFTARKERLVRESLEHRLAARDLRERLAKEKPVMESGWPYDSLDVWGRYFDGVRDQQWFSPGMALGAKKSGAYYPFFTSEMDLQLLRDGSRITVETGTNSLGLLGGLCAYTVGTGPTIRAAPKKGVDAEAGKSAANRCQAVIDEFVKREQFNSRSREFFRRSRRDGEALFRVFDHGENGLTSVRFVWPEQIRTPLGEPGVEWSLGVHADPDDSETLLEYAIHPLDGPSSGDADIVPAEDIVHFRANVDTGIKRGVPDFAWGVADVLAIAKKLSMRMGEGSATQAAIAYVRQHAGATKAAVQAFGTAEADYRKPKRLGTTETPVREWDSGTIVDTNENTTFVASPYSPGIDGHLAVAQFLLRQACVRWNAPEWLGSADISNTVFASSMVGESPFVIRIKQSQDDYATCWLPLFHRVLRNATRAGRLDANDLACVDVVITLPNPEARDKFQQAQTNSAELQDGYKSPQMCAEENGYDWARVVADRKAIMAGGNNDGIALPVPKDSTGENADPTAE